MSVSDDFVGSGIAFPLRLDATGSFELVSRDREIAESIHLILGTARGERPMRPEFGCGIHDHVFGEADNTTAGLLAQEVSQSLTRWEPRIDVISIDVDLDTTEANRFTIVVTYAIRGSNDPRNLVFPFYVIPGESA